jgi:hypothetical protein
MESFQTTTSRTTLPSSEAQAQSSKSFKEQISEQDNENLLGKVHDVLRRIYRFTPE